MIPRKLTGKSAHCYKGSEVDCGSCKYQEALKLQERTQCHAQKIQHKHMRNLCSDALNKDVTRALGALESNPCPYLQPTVSTMWETRWPSG